VLDERGNPDAPYGSPKWIVAERLALVAQIKRTETSVDDVRVKLWAFRDKEFFRQLVDKTNHPFMSFESFCETPWPYGLGLPPGVGPAIIAEKNKAKTIATIAQELAADPNMKALASGPGRPEGSRNNVANRHINSLSSDSAERIIRRLKRDAPEIAEALANGDYKSARAAAIAAGIITPPTTLDQLRRSWRKATPLERKTFLKEVS
jgi:hypothetical protein